MEELEFTSADLVDGKLLIPDARIVDFSVEDEEGKLIIPSRFYSAETGATTVDFTGWEVRGSWHIRKIPVAPGIDAAPGVSLDEYLVRLYLLRGDGKYLPYVGSRPSFPIVREKKAPLLGTRFVASGKEQLVSGEIIPAVIPAFGEARQYVGVSEISAGAEGILYHFQVYRETMIIFEQTQDSLNYPADYAHHGNLFHFPENLPARLPEEEPKLAYRWRVRASYKIADAAGELYWSGWSHSFPFEVNLPPGAPFDLSVFA